jgi:hypothetical protein
VTLEHNVEALNTSVNKVRAELTTTNQAVTSLSNAVSNLTTKRETAIMQNRLEHMFGRLRGRTHNAKYNDFPPELQLTLTDSLMDTENGIEAMSNEEYNAPVSTLTVTTGTGTATTNKTIGRGNHNNGHLDSNMQTNSPAPK